MKTPEQITEELSNYLSGEWKLHPAIVHSTKKKLNALLKEELRSYIERIDRLELEILFPRVKGGES